MAGVSAMAGRAKFHTRTAYASSRTTFPSAFQRMRPRYVPGFVSAAVLTLIQTGCVVLAATGPAFTGAIGSGHQPVQPSEPAPVDGYLSVHSGFLLL